jgi:hypothetical protein
MSDITVCNVEVRFTIDFGDKQFVVAIGNIQGDSDLQKVVEIIDKINRKPEKPRKKK